MAQAPTKPPLALRMRSGTLLDDPSSSSSSSDSNASCFGRDGQTQGAAQPTLAHRFANDSSILCLAATDKLIIAGTQRGQILVFALDTFERSRVIQAHHGSVLGLCLSRDGALLFSSGSDRLVNVWDARTLTRKAALYSQYDVGDIFCVSYSAGSGILYMGCQNTSLLWCDVKHYPKTMPKTPNGHPIFSQDTFFNSLGPGGVKHPRQEAEVRSPLHGTELALEIPKENVLQFAHFGYIYCMVLTAGSNANLPVDEILVTGGGDGAISLWTMDGQDGGRVNHVARLEDDRDESESIISIVLDGTLLFCGRTGGEIHVWDLEARQLVRVLNNTSADILSLSTDSTALYCLTADGSALQYNQRYDHVGSWQAHTGRALASVFLKAKHRLLLLTGGNDDSVAVWDVKSTTSPITNQFQRSEDQLINSLREFVSYRTVSCDARYSTACRRGASWLRSHFKALGAATELLKTDDGCNPIVLAKFRGDATDSKSKKRVLFYGHYDVIAADDKQRKWISDPFSMTGMDGYYYGRGVTDNKGPIMAALYAVAELMKDRKLASDVVFLIEGEEECGSRKFAETVQRHREMIGPVDWILLANSYWLDDEVPCLTYGLRGVIHATVEIESEHPDLHSGVDGSMLLDEPLKDLINLLAKLNGPRGAIEIPDFYDSVLPVKKPEKALYDEISRSLLARDPSLGTPQSLTESLMQRWRNASLTVHGFKTSGSEKSTIIPHYASAALSIRLVPNQESESISTALASYLRTEFAQMQSKNMLKVKINHQAEPWLGDPNNQIFRSLEKAVADVWSSHRRRGSSSKPPHSPRQGATRSACRPSTAGSNPPSVATSNMLAWSSNATTASPEVSAIDCSNDFAPLSPVLGQRAVTAVEGVPRSPPQWKPLYIREGGSIPAIRFLEKEFSAPAANLPCGQASDNAHLDNERLRVTNLLNAREIFRRVFLDLMA